MQSHLFEKIIAFTTTNGTQALIKSLGAREIIIGSFLNLTAVADYLKKGSNNILIVCAGWKGKVNLEDTLFAGALVEKLNGIAEAECDAPLVAQHLYEQAKENLEGFLKNSSHVKRLAKLGIQKDVSFCLTLDQYDVVPILYNNMLVAAT